LLVFLFSFVPLVGAIVSGAIAVLLVLVLNSWIGAIIMLAIVLVVQQAESNILQPFLMGKAGELHPLAVLLGVAAGGMVANIAGALYAITLVACVDATLLCLVGRDPAPDLGEDRASAEHFAALTRTQPAPVQGGTEGAERRSAFSALVPGAKTAPAQPSASQERAPQEPTPQEPAAQEAAVQSSAGTGSSAPQAAPSQETPAQPPSPQDPPAQDTPRDGD